MILPEYITQCLSALESAGFAAYAVGGCVRDACLGLTPHDYDLCTAALPEQTETVFADHKLVLAGKKHGTVGVVTPCGVVEITTFRREGDYLDNRHPEWVEFVPDIKEDLARRDFTVNAMAYSPIRGFADPFGGRQDLKQGILRAVGDPVQRFREDSLRILRGIRFAVRYDLQVEEATMEAMVSQAHLMDNLARERVFEELNKLLPLVDAGDLLTFGPLLAAVIPELKPLIGFDQRSPHHAYDLYTHVDLDMIGHDPHELAAYLSAVLQGYTRQSAQAELERVFNAQYQLTLTEEVEVRYRTETRTDSEGNSYTVEVPYNYYILNVTLTSKPISSVATELLTPDQLEMYQVYRTTLGNKPLIFGGGSTNTSDSESLEGVEFINGTRPGNQAVVDIAKSQVGDVGGQPYWSWYGFNSRVEWCACFVSWCYGQMGLSEPRFAACQSQGIPWFQSHGQWGARGYDNLAPGDAIFFDWDLDGSADHVGIVIGTDGSRVYTVEGNSGDACKIRSYDVNYECIKGYGLMNW